MLEAVLTVLVALSLVLHIPAVLAAIKKSKTKLDDKLVDAVDAGKDLLQK